jgi:hypothetical protein
VLQETSVKKLQNHARAAAADEATRLQQSEGKVKYISEQLANALADITAKDNLVKQHAKVAEEAVSGTHEKSIKPTFSCSKMHAFWKIPISGKNAFVSGNAKVFNRGFMMMRRLHIVSLIICTKLCDFRLGESRIGSNGFEATIRYSVTSKTSDGGSCSTP